MIKFPRSLPVPAEILDIARRLEGAGFETWCVGGAVRDSLLKLASPGSADLDYRDFDLATAARPDAVQELFGRKNTVPVGVDHGTVAVLDRRRTAHEVTTFRKDVRTDGRHAIVEFGATVEEDLARRDFTINAIAYHPLRHEWRDPFDGRADLEAGIIRAVGEPAARFREDYLRILRGLRFSARFGFAIEPATWAAARAEAPGLETLSAERVRDEWTRALQTAQRPSQVVQLWAEAGGLERWLPEIVPERGADLDRFEKRDAVLMTAWLSRDPAATLTRLRSSNADIARAAAVAERGREPDPADRVAVRRWMAARGRAVDDLLALARVADRRKAAELDAAVAVVRASGAPLSLSDLAVTGDDLKKDGIPAGKAMGAILRALLDEVLENPEQNERGVLLERARRLAERGVG